MIRRGRYPTDPRLHRTVRTLLDAGHEVDVICVREPGRPGRWRQDGLRVTRLRVPSDVGGPVRLALHYAVFFVLAAALVSARHLRGRYDLIHVQSLPDTLVFVAAIPRALGSRVVLDLAECWPEYVQTRFALAAGHPLIRFAAALEQLSIRFAHRVVTCTEQMRERFIRRGAEAGKIGVVLNTPDESVFDVARHPHQGSEDGEFVLLCHGTVEPRYGIDVVIRAMALLREEIPGLRLEVYGTGSGVAELEDLARVLGVGERVWFARAYVPVAELLDALARADAGVVAVHRDPFRDLTHCNKMFELVAMHVPVIATRTRSVTEYLGESSLEYFESGDAEDLAGAIRRLADDPARREQLVRRALETVEPYRWAGQSRALLEHIAV